MSTFKHNYANMFQQRLNAEYVYCSAPTFWGANHFSFAYERMSTFRDLFIFIFAQAPYRLNPILNPSISSYLIREFKNSLIHEFTNSSAWRRCGPMGMHSHAPMSRRLSRERAVLSVFAMYGWLARWAFARSHGACKTVDVHVHG